MNYYTERNGIRKSKEYTYVIDPGRYKLLLDCCKRYYENIAWKYPVVCNRCGCCCGLDQYRMANEIIYYIPGLFISDYGRVDSPKVIKNIFFQDDPIIDEYDQNAFLDFIEFIAEHTFDIEKKYSNSCRHFQIVKLDSRVSRQSFIDEINNCFLKAGLLYELSSDGEIKKVIQNDVVTPELADIAMSIEEKGIKELLKEAIDLHYKYRQNAARDSVEKIWDAFERIKSYYTDLDKLKSSKKIVSNISNGSESFRKLIDAEFLKLTEIGNSFRIRHHEMDRFEIIDDRHYEYLFDRCFSLIALAIQFLE